jgi:hypothetical protein
MMKFNLMVKKIDHYKLTIILILAGILFHIIYLIQFNDYYDDWNFFYTVDPSVSNNQTWQRHYYGDRGDGTYLKEAFPWNFTFLTKYVLKIIGYSVENTHYFLLFFSVLSYFLFGKIVFLISKNFRFILFTIILFITNLFLIRELNSFRPHSLVMFLGLLNIFFFILIFIKKKFKNKYLIFYAMSSVAMLSFWPHTLALFGGNCIYLLFYYVKEKKIKILFLPILIIVFYLLFNFRYLQYLIFDNSWSYTPLEFNFFFNYFFRSFFGSILFGGLILLVFIYNLYDEIKLNLLNLNKNFSNLPIFQINIKNFLLINILGIYIISISYSLLKESVIAPKYFLILIPLVIIWIGLKTVEYKKNLLSLTLITFSFLNFFYYWSDLPIDRPDNKKVLKMINQKNIAMIYTTESIVFNNFLSKHKYSIKNNLKILKIENLDTKSEETFAILCLNFPRFAHGENINKKIDKKCQNINDDRNLKILDTINIPDYLIYYAKNRIL